MMIGCENCCADYAATTSRVCAPASRDDQGGASTRAVGQLSASRDALDHRWLRTARSGNVELPKIGSPELSRNEGTIGHEILVSIRFFECG